MINTRSMPHHRGDASIIANGSSAGKGFNAGFSLERAEAATSKFPSDIGGNPEHEGILSGKSLGSHAVLVAQSPETDPLSREFRRISCGQSVRELIHEMAQIQDMLIMDSRDPWADIQRRTALLDPGFREILERHMARAAALIERIERDCGDVLSPEELAECERLKDAFERMRRYVSVDLITAGGELVETAYQRLVGTLRDVSAGVSDFLGVVIAGLGASAAFLMEHLLNRHAY